MLFQNLREPNAYQVGIYKVPTQSHNLIFFLMKALYIIGWTWLLNHLCKRGYGGVSWFLLLLPFIGFFCIDWGRSRCREFNEINLYKCISTRKINNPIGLFMF